MRQHWAMERNTHLVGQSTSFLDAVERASRAAPLDRPVLVIGERGTGKELIAERLHHLSSRWDGPLIVMNCAALPETLIEAELFGHEAGAFTGATKARPGRFEEANGGTLFLDELATLSSPAQDRLLRAIEYGEVTRIGASQAAPGRRPHRRRDQRASAAPGRGRPLPRRPARPAELRGRHPAAAPPPRRATSPSSPTISAAGWRSSIEMGAWPGFSEGAMEQAPGLSLARQRPRAAQRRRARRLPLGRARRARSRTSSSTRSKARGGRCGPGRSPTAPRKAGGARRARKRRRQPRGGPTRRLAATTPDECADFRLAVAEYEKAILAAALEKCRWNQRAAAAALSLTYDQLRHAMRRHELQGG